MYLVLVYRIPQAAAMPMSDLAMPFRKFAHLSRKKPLPSQQTRQGRMEFIKEETNKLPSQRGKDRAAALFYPAQQQRR